METPLVGDHILAGNQHQPQAPEGKNEQTNKKQTNKKKPEPFS